MTTYVHTPSGGLSLMTKALSQYARRKEYLPVLAALTLCEWRAEGPRSSENHAGVIETTAGAHSRSSDHVRTYRVESRGCASVQ